MAPGRVPAPQKPSRRFGAPSSFNLMRLLSLSWLILIPLAAAAGCSTASTSAASPAELALEPSKIELGKVPAGAQIPFKCEIRNTGGSPLQILGVVTDCGCLTPRYPGTVPPDSSAVLEGYFEPQATWSGRIEKKLQIKTNDPKRPEVSLPLIATVIPYVEANPPAPLQLTYAPGETYTREVTLTPREGSGLSLGQIETNQPWLKARLTPKGESYLMSLTIGPMDGYGDRSGAVQIETTLPELQQYWHAVSVLAASGPVLSPDRIRLPFIKRPPTPGDELARVQVFTRSGGLKVKSAKSVSPLLTTEVKPMAGGSATELILRVAPTGAWNSGPFETEIVIATDDPKHPSLKLPFVATVQ